MEEYHSNASTFRKCVFEAFYDFIEFNGLCGKCTISDSFNPGRSDWYYLAPRLVF